jgi:hypothetical protein
MRVVGIRFGVTHIVLRILLAIFCAAESSGWDHDSLWRSQGFRHHD